MHTLQCECSVMSSSVVFPRTLEALYITGSPANEWQEEWNNIAVSFGTRAYDYNSSDRGIRETNLLCFWLTAMNSNHRHQKSVLESIEIHSK